MVRDESTLVGLAYRAVEQEHLWGELLQRITDQLRGTCAFFTATHYGEPLPSIGYPADSQEAASECRAWRATVETWMRDARLEDTDPLLLPRRGTGPHTASILTAVIEAHGQQRACLSVCRGADRPAFDGDEIALFQRVTNHVRQAVSLARRFDKIGDWETTLRTVLEHVGTGVVVVDESLQVLLVNAVAGEILGARSEIAVVEGRLRLQHASTARRLQGLVGEACRIDAAERGAPLALLPVFGSPRDPLLLAVAPDLGCTPRSVIFLLHADPDATEGIDVLCGIYGLTPMEARLARYVGCATTLSDAARRLGITKGTARAYLREVFRKMGVSRQSELVRRVSAGIDRLNLPARPAPRRTSPEARKAPRAR